MTSSLSRILSHGSIYFVGNILRYSVSFVMLPIYTRVLTPADYGLVEMLNMVIDFTAIILGLRIGESIFRFYNGAETESEKGAVISTGLLMVFGLNAIGVALLWGGAETISGLVLGGPEHAGLLMLFSVTLLLSPLVEIPMVFVRAQQRPWLFVAFSTTKLALQLSLNIYLVVYLRMHVEGVVISAVVANAVMAALLSVYCFSQVGMRFSYSSAREMVVFSYPLVLSSLLSFYVTFGDRYFLKALSGLEDVGIYALGYKFGFLLSFLVSGPFFSIWDSEKYNVLKQEEPGQVYRRVFLMFNVYALLAAAGIAMFSQNLLVVMSDEAFWPARHIIPVVLLAYVFQAWTGYSNLGVLLERRTMYIARGNVVSVVVATVAYIALIPLFGAMGAAAATVLAFFSRFLYVYMRSKQFYDMGIAWREVAWVFGPAVGVVLVSLAGPEQFVAGVAVNTALALVLLLSYIYLPILPKAERELLRDIARKPLSRGRLLFGAGRS